MGGGERFRDLRADAGGRTVPGAGKTLVVSFRSVSFRLRRPVGVASALDTVLLVLRAPSRERSSFSLLDELSHGLDRGEGYLSLYAPAYACMRMRHVTNYGSFAASRNGFSVKGRGRGVAMKYRLLSFQETRPTQMSLHLCYSFIECH